MFWNRWRNRYVLGWLLLFGRLAPNERDFLRNIRGYGGRPISAGQHEWLYGLYDRERKRRSRRASRRR
jgi:hypothetical protein